MWRAWFDMWHMLVFFMMSWQFLASGSRLTGKKEQRWWSNTTLPHYNPKAGHGHLWLWKINLMKTWINFFFFFNFCHFPKIDQFLSNKGPYYICFKMAKMINSAKIFVTYIVLNFWVAVKNPDMVQWLPDNSSVKISYSKQQKVALLIWIFYRRIKIPNFSLPWLYYRFYKRKILTIV